MMCLGIEKMGEMWNFSLTFCGDRALVNLVVLIYFCYLLIAIGEIKWVEVMQRGPKGKKKIDIFIMDCSKLVEDKIMDIASLEKFL